MFGWECFGDSWLHAALLPRYAASAEARGTTTSRSSCGRSSSSFSNRAANSFIRMKGAAREGALRAPPVHQAESVCDIKRRGMSMCILVALGYFGSAFGSSDVVYLPVVGPTWRAIVVGCQACRRLCRCLCTWGHLRHNRQEAKGVRSIA